MVWVGIPSDGVFYDVLSDGVEGLWRADDVVEIIALPDGHAGMVPQGVDAACDGGFE